MNFEKINANQYMWLIVLFVLGSTIQSNIAAGAGTDMWLVYLVSLLVGIFFAAMYYRLLKLHDFLSLPAILENIFGYWGGKILCVLFALYFLARSDMVGEITTEMANDLLMHNAPRRLTVGILLFSTLYACHKGLRTIGRSGEIISLVIGICLLPFLLTAFSAEAFLFKNLRPILTTGAQVFWKKTFAVSITPFTEIGLFAVLACKVDKRQHQVIFKQMVKALVISALLLILVGTINLSILGKHLVASLKYPFYNAMMLTGIHGVLERLDPLAVVIIVTSSFYKVALLFYCWIEMICSLSHQIKRNVVIALTAITFFFAGQNATYLYEKFQTVILPFWIMPLFQIVFPILVWLITEIKVYFKRKV